MTVLPIVVGDIIKVLSGREKDMVELETRGRTETILTIPLLQSARILLRVLDTRSVWLPLNTPVKSSQLEDAGKNCNNNNNNDYNNNNRVTRIQMKLINRSMYNKRY